MALKRDLHPALLHLLLALFTIACFCVVAEQVVNRRPITTFDFHQAERFHDFTAKHQSVWDFAWFITDLGSGRPRIAVVIAVSLLLLAHGQCRLTIWFAATQWIFQEVVGWTKGLFERPRPPFFDPAQGLAGGWSFPSGHAAGAMVTYGMIANLVAWRWPDYRGRWLLIAGLGVIILVVGLSRMLLGVHYFTDIVGGYLLGLTYISLCVAGIELVRSIGRRSHVES
jgi:undecaprenyl-diphosphatase